MNKNPILPAVLASLLLISGLPAFAQIVSLDSGSYTILNSNDSTALLTGDVVQFGYFTNATMNNPFAGTFVALTGPSTTDTLQNGTTFTGNPVIGQDTGEGAGPGTFAYSLLNLNPASSAIPANGTVMAFVIYNNSTVASSTDYAAEADLATTWNYSSSAQFPIAQSFGLDDTGTWENNVVGYTGIPLTQVSAPEPQTGLMFILGGLLLAAWCWKSRRA